MISITYRIEQSSDRNFVLHATSHSFNYSLLDSFVLSFIMSFLFIRHALFHLFTIWICQPNCTFIELFGKTNSIHVVVILLYCTQRTFIGLEDMPTFNKITPRTTTRTFAPQARHLLVWYLVMRYSLRPFAPFGSCQLLSLVRALGTCSQENSSLVN